MKVIAKNFKWYIAGAVIIIVIIVLVITMPKKTEGGYTTVPMYVGKNTYKALVADTQALQVQGLSDRLSLPADHVMLFSFDQADNWGIWMKDMQFPLDIFWLNDAKQVITFYTNVATSTYPTAFSPVSPAKYVVEANVGFAEANKVSTGTTFRF